MSIYNLIPYLDSAGNATRDNSLNSDCAATSSCRRCSIIGHPGTFKGILAHFLCLCVCQ